MKKQLALGMILSLFIAGAGCAAQPAASAAPQNSTETTAPAQASGDAKPADASGATQQEGQRPQMEAPSYTGQVDRIIGNEVTLRLAEMPQRTEGQTSGTKPVTAPTGQSSTRTGEGMGASGAARRTELTFTGESKQIIIPVGVPIESFSKNSTDSLELSDITAGSNIMLWEDESQTIVRVRVMKGASQ